MSGFVESGGRFTSNPVAAFDRIWCPLSFESRTMHRVIVDGVVLTKIMDSSLGESCEPNYHLKLSEPEITVISRPSADNLKPHTHNRRSKIFSFLWKINLW